MNKKLPFIKPLRPIRNINFRNSDNNTKTTCSPARQSSQSDETLNYFKTSMSQRKIAFPLISRRKSETRVFITARESQQKKINHLRSTSNSNIEIMNQETNFKSKIGKFSRNCNLESLNADIVKKKSVTESKNSLSLRCEGKYEETKTKDNKTLLNPQLIKKSVNKEENLKSEFMVLEECFEILMNRSKSNTFKTAKAFSKLLSSLYHLTRQVRKKFFKNPIPDTGVSCLADFSDVSSIDIFTVSEDKPYEMACNSNSSKIFKSQKQDLKIDLFNFNTDFCKPVKINNDKIQLEEILKMSEVKIKSKCIIRAYDNIVEEEYLICALRPITDVEKNNLNKNETERLRNNTFNINKKESKILDCNSIVSHRNKSMQTLVGGASNCNIHTQTVMESCAENSLTSLEDSTETCWFIDNISDDDLNFQMESSIMSPILKANIVKEIAKLILENAKCSIYFNATKGNNGLKIINEPQFVEPLKTKIDFISIDGIILDKPVWTVHGTKIKSVLNCISAIKISKDVIINYSKKYLNINYQIVKINSEKANFLPLTLNDKDSDEISVTKVNEICNSTSIESNIQSVDSLSRLYERLSKLQKMLECIPEDKITSIVETSADCDVQEFKAAITTSLGDCSINDDLTDHSINQKTITKSDIRNRDIIQHQFKSYPEHFNETELDDDQSDATSSLSLLENLIDDFLTKNGLKKFTEA